MLRTDGRRTAAIAALCAAMLGGAALLQAGPLHGLPAPDGRAGLPWWALVPLFTAAELLIVHVQARRETLSVSFVGVPLVLGLVVLTPLELLLASAAGATLVVLKRRQAPLKVLVNTSLIVVEATCAAALYHLALAGADPAGLRGVAAALTTTVLTDLVSATVLTLVIYLRVGDYDDGVLREAVSSGLFLAVANTSVGLLVAVLLGTAPAALVLVLVIAAVLVLAYRGYTEQGQQHARLESLYRFTRTVGRTVETDAVVESVLRQARDVLSADGAELVLLGAAPTGATTGTAAGIARRLRLSGEDAVEELAGGEAAPAAWWRAALEGRAVRATRSGELHDGARDGLAAPVGVADDVVGVLVVTDRPRHLPTFTEADLRLFASLASHASISLQNSRLVDQLRSEAAAQQHRALHDPSTGLPNRLHCLRALEEALRRSPRAAVLVLDLDGFKEVNDALGRSTGDELLAETGRRLRAIEPRPGHVARLGNDEFAVLLPEVDGADGAERWAREVLRAVTAPLALHGLGIDLRASAGLAVAPDHGQDAEALLQHADTAVYEAKSRREPLRTWDAASAGDSARRLALLADLRDAIADRQLQVHYQPKVAPGTARPYGAEALVRWEHPTLGRLSPDRFIPLAEHSDLVQPLTAVVLDEALAQCARWRARGALLSVAVNLSTRSLADTAIVKTVAGALERAGVPAEALTLEITETAVMGDLDRALEVLHGLRALGVRLSVDDFGTGQSSLGYLKRLPVHEVKIDKSFVDGLAGASGDARATAVVKAAVDLGHALGLQVVAEGVEDEPTLRQLDDLGCDLVQGYVISRPLPAGAFVDWLGTAASCGAPPFSAAPAPAAPGSC
ncbi:diguanylate cyclase/phosphodiesterase [Quadrisphaera sp. DSM 44207]|nr:diguanylate cyclase/phosphodiesterase [Quadrisphaera sp. DSM 44207]